METEEKTKTWACRTVTAGVYEYTDGEHVLRTCGTPPGVVFDLFHRGQKSLGDELRGNCWLDGEFMSLKLAVKLLEANIV